MDSTKFEINNDDGHRTAQGAIQKMSTNAEPLPEPKKRLLSLDTWAVLVALAAALLIRTGVLSHVPW